MNTANEPEVLPASGPGSPASWPRRFIALAIDWALGNVVAVVLAGDGVLDPDRGPVWLPLLCWFGVVTLTTAFTGASTGQWMLGIRVVRLDRRRMELVRSAARTALIALVVPPLIFDKNKRGLHDLAANTAAVKAPDRRLST